MTACTVRSKVLFDNFGFVFAFACLLKRAVVVTQICQKVNSTLDIKVLRNLLSTIHQVVTLVVRLALILVSVNDFCFIGCYLRTIW